MLTRRKLLTLIAGAGIGLFPIYRLISKIFDRIPELPIQDNYFSGFLILEEGQPVQTNITYPKVKIQKLCFVDKPAQREDIENYPTWITSFEELRNVSIDKRIYMLDSQVSDLAFVGAYTMYGSDNSTYGISQGYRSSRGSLSEEQADYFLWSQFYFPQPFPVWKQSKIDEEHLGVDYEQVNFLPQPGLQVTTPLGYVFHWIEGGVFYILSLENLPTLDDAMKVIESLIKN